MYFCSVISRKWKIISKTVLGTFSLFAIVLILPVTTEAVDEWKRAVVRANDGHVYEIQYITPLNIENIEKFSIRGLDGTIPSREVAAELYIAEKFLTLPPLNSDEDLELWVEEIYTDTAKWKTIHEIAKVVGAAPYKVLLAKVTAGTSAAEDIAAVAALIGRMSLEAAVLLKARTVGVTFARRAKQAEQIFKEHWLFVDQGNETSIDNIKQAYLSFWKEAEYRNLTYGIINEHLFLPGRWDRIANFLSSLVPYADTIGFFNSATLDQVQLSWLEEMLESAEGEVTNKASAKVDEIFNEGAIANTILTLEGAGFYDREPPTIERSIEDMQLMVGDSSRLLDLATLFNDPNGDRLEHAIEVADRNVADVKIILFRPDGALLFKPFLEITPKRVGSTSVTIKATDPTRLFTTQTFTITVDPAELPNQPPKAVGKIPSQTLSENDAPVAVDVAGYFNDSNNTTLIYTAASDNAAVVLAQMSGSQVTITPVGAGNASVAVTASNGALTARQTISVSVIADLPEETWMPDANLRVSVRDALDLAPSDTLTRQAMLGLISLRYRGSELSDNEKIVNLTGLEYALNLDHLNLYGHLISDILPLERLTRLRSLWLAGNKIANIRPLTSLPLKELGLGGNPIVDFTPLTELTSLTRLDLWGNGISNNDLHRITRLTQLTQLDLRYNQISDITSLTELVNLKKLQLKGNPISDTSPLRELLRQNPDLEIDIEISDEPPSEPDPKIETEGPDLVIEALRVNNTTVTAGDQFRLNAVIRNQGKAASGAATVRFYRSSDETISAEDTLIDRSSLPVVAANATRNKWLRLTAPNTAGVYYYGVCIEDVANESDTENNCSTTVKITVGTVPAKPPAVERPTPAPEVGEDPPQEAIAITVEEPPPDPVASPVPGTPENPEESDLVALPPPPATGTISTQELKVGDAPVVIDVSHYFAWKADNWTARSSKTDVVTASTSGSEVTLTAVGSGWATITVEAGIGGFASKHSFFVSVGGVAIPLIIPDANLREAVSQTLNLGTNVLITPQTIQRLTNLDVGGTGTKSLTGLEHATGLKRLRLRWHQIRDVRPLAGLTNLRALSLEQNQISDLSPLKGLTSLTELHFGGNPISDIDFLSVLTNLTELGTRFCQIRDIRPLENLTALRELDISSNQISDIHPLAGLTNLTKLQLWGNQIRDVRPLENLTALKKLTLDRNPIADLEPLRRLKAKNPNMQIDIDLNAGAAPAAPVLPDETALLPNYPNPFNPETWIPYQLAVAADVTLIIYDVRGVVVRGLALGHKPAGFYQSQARAAHWDGRNALGEKVASGLYFYRFTAGDFTATGKMLIRK